MEHVQQSTTYNYKRVWFDSCKENQAWVYLWAAYRRGNHKRQNTETFPSYEWNRILKISQASFPALHTIHICDTRHSSRGEGGWRDWDARLLQSTTNYKHFKTRQKSLYFQRGEAGVIRNLIHCAPAVKTTQNSAFKTKTDLYFLL